jgi:hypothetical protein
VFLDQEYDGSKMTFFVGHTGAIKLQRSGEASIRATVSPDDINTVLNRFSFEGSEDNLITGDLVEISTNDPRGIAFVSGVTEDYRAYINVNSMGGIRLFESFEDAVNNERANEVPLLAFAGDPILVDLEIKDTRHNTLGSVVSFDINTDRAAIDTTSLSDAFRQQYSAGLLSGNGSIECLFSYETVTPQETPLFLLQVINRLDVGSTFKALLSLSSVEQTPSFVEEVYYDIEAVVTRAGVTVSADALVSCSIDFVTTGEFKLRVGVPPEYILKEDDDAIYLEQSLDYLLQEATD